MFFATIGRIVFGAIVGWTIGVLLHKLTFWYDNRRLEKKMKRSKTREEIVVLLYK